MTPQKRQPMHMFDVLKRDLSKEKSAHRQSEICLLYTSDAADE